MRLRRHLAEGHAHDREGSLHDGHGDGREQDTYPERRGEGQGGEEVERRLQRELVDAPSQPVGQRPEHGQRSDAEEQRGGQPALDEAFSPGVPVG